MRVCNLASGSTGNCTYVETESVKILIDAGLSIADLQQRLSLLGITIDDIDAVVVSHEHVDHVRCVQTLANKHDIKVYAHVNEWPALNSKVKKINPTKQIAFFDLPFEIGDLNITPIQLPHDSHTCFGFCVENNNKKFSILTDLGQTNDRILSAVEGSVLVFIEANHDEMLLRSNPNYPQVLKQRILSSKGHLSNIACASAVARLVQTGTKQIMLSHLSEKNNTPQLAYKTVCSALAARGIVEGEHVRVSVALADRPTAIFNLK